MSIEWLSPAWDAPATVRAACTLRLGGVSAVPFASLNLGAGVGDEPAAVAENRRRLLAGLALPAEPRGCSRYGTEVFDADGQPGRGCGGDAPDDRVLATWWPIHAGALASDDGVASRGACRLARLVWASSKPRWLP
jgi:hypothetical protein